MLGKQGSLPQGEFLGWLLGGLALEAGMSGAILPHALAQHISYALLQFLLMSSEGLILLFQKTWHSLEKCCCTPKLGHWGK